ncbi:MAG: YigZ family protein [Salinivirgaceae bacterium]|nr:MAG: YigZ family protein [Salinivirgaceae bacterium]
MSDFDLYRTIKSPSKGSFKDRGSKFFAFAYPIETEDEFKENMQVLKKEYHDARHHVYAFRLGSDKKTYRASDDGEPSNSSGPPVLGQIQSYDLTNVMIVVVRYFGGTKLGVPGLINAYRSAAADAIENAKIIEKTEEKTVRIQFEYPDMNNVMRIIKDQDLNIINQDFQLACIIDLSVRLRDIEQVLERVNKLEKVTAKTL